MTTATSVPSYLVPVASWVVEQVTEAAEDVRSRGGRLQKAAA